MSDYPFKMLKILIFFVTLTFALSEYDHYSAEMAKKDTGLALEVLPTKHLPDLYGKIKIKASEGKTGIVLWRAGSRSV